MRVIMGSLLVFALSVSPRAGHADGAKGAPAKSTPAKSEPPKAEPAKPATAKPVKQETRAELETEVEKLRAENVKLRTELDALKAREADRQKRLQEQMGGSAPNTTLK